MDAERLLSGFDVDGRLSSAREIATHADKYATSLSRYWSYAREHTSDLYLHKNFGDFEWHADKSWFESRNNEFKEVDRTLGEQLSTWEAATSPYADKIDVVAASVASQNLRVTIEEALAKTKVEGIPDLANKQATAEYTYNFRMSVALAALSEQIGKRLEAIGNGTPQPLSVTRQMSDFLARASGMKELGELFRTEAAELQALRQEFFDTSFTAASLDKMRTRQAELIELLRDPNLSANDRNLRLRERRKIEASLEAWRHGMELVSMSASQRSALSDARIDFNEAVRKLGQDLSKKDRADWTKSRTERADKLLKLETPFISRAADGVKRYADEASQRSDRYEQALADIQNAASANKLDDVWTAVKNRCLKEGRAVSGEIARALDQAFDQGLSNQLTTWEKKWSTRGRKDAAEMLALASNLAETIDSYSTRGSAILEKNSEMESVHNRLQCGLQAIRERITTELNRRLELGEFGSPFS
jgi:hypothetical protein